MTEQEQIAQLKARVAELEQTPAVRHFIHREVAALRRIKDLEAEVRRLQALVPVPGPSAGMVLHPR